MSRIWNFGSKHDRAGTATLTNGHRAPYQQASPPGLPPGQLWDPELDPDDEDEPEHYVARPVRPIAQIAARVALWGAVGLGALGGVMSLVNAAAGEEPAPVEEVDESIGVPAPVAGVAELTVERWLTASEENAEEVAALFVEPPDFENTETEALEVLDVKSVAGLRLEEGYWSVTVAARVVEVVGDLPPTPSTWYVEVGIVGDISKGLAALTTPAVVPPPTLAESPWQPTAGHVEAPADDDRIAGTTEGFLNALLAGKGDPGRYLAPRVRIPAIDPAPFAEVTVTGLAVTEIDDDEIRIWVLADLTTAAGSVHTAGYEIEARQRIDRWEILSVWGAPAVEAVPVSDEEDEGGAEPGSGTPATTATTSIDEATDDSATDDSSPDDTADDTATDDTTEDTLTDDTVEGTGEGGDGTTTTYFPGE